MSYSVVTIKTSLTSPEPIYTCMIFVICVRESVSVSVLTNGNIQFLRDVDQCLKRRSVMVS